MPVLHGMRNIRSLNHVFDDNSGQAITVLGTRPHGNDFILQIKGLFPTIVSESLQLPIHDICRHHRVYHELTESIEFSFRSINALTQFSVAGLHEKRPRDGNTVLLCNTAVVVTESRCSVFIGKLRVWDAGVIHIVDKRRKETRKLEKRIRGDTICMIVTAFVRTAVTCVKLAFKNSREQFQHTHQYMRAMLKIVESMIMI
mmetsp:Transcript_15985/g.33031  ORF Transcript_15985/g.33031 Transcript_15985/m.33031 type:complete len:201 (-) Transcript_15985:2161-2763(-)